MLFENWGVWGWDKVVYAGMQGYSTFFEGFLSESFFFFKYCHLKVPFISCISVLEAQNLSNVGYQLILWSLTTQLMKLRSWIPGTHQLDLLKWKTDHRSAQCWPWGNEIVWRTLCNLHLTSFRVLPYHYISTSIKEVPSQGMAFLFIVASRQEQLWCRANL